MNDAKKLLLLDNIDSLKVDPEMFVNELQTLQHLRSGLDYLYNNFVEIETQISTPNYQVFHMCSPFPPDKNMPEELNKFSKNLGNFPTGIIVCSLHWYAIVACNYVRLVGWMGLYKDTGKAKKYLENVIPEILLWRHKVAAHFALIDPRDYDNNATLMHSVMHPYEISEGKIVAGGMNVTMNESGKMLESAIPKWILTDEHQKLCNRYKIEYI